jgi:hypothetical protein
MEFRHHLGSALGGVERHLAHVGREVAPVLDADLEQLVGVVRRLQRLLDPLLLQLRHLFHRLRQPLELLVGRLLEVARHHVLRVRLLSHCKSPGFRSVDPSTHAGTE